MKSETPLAERPAADSHHTFAVQLGASRRSARLARRITVRHLTAWGYAAGSDVSQTVALLVSELCTNAVTHGHVSGRDFHLRVAAGGGTKAAIRIEVCDANPEPPSSAPLPPGWDVPSPDADSGRGLLLVEALATRWGWIPRASVGKTVWAEVQAGPR